MSKYLPADKKFDLRSKTRALYFVTRPNPSGGYNQHRYQENAGAIDAVLREAIEAGHKAFIEVIRRHEYNSV